MDEKSIEKRAEELKQQFDAISSQIQEIVTTTNKQLQEMGDQIKTVRDTAQKKVDELNIELEQIRGAYTELVYLLHPELRKGQQIKESVKEETVTESVKEEPVKEDNSVQIGSLTAEEVNKITDVVKETQTEQEDIPGYLKEEYNK